MTPVQREPFFFEAEGRRLFGLWRQRISSSANKVWVVCPPFQEEEKSAHRNLAEVAEALAARGEPSLTLAYTATGDSEGTGTEATLAHWKSDIGAACAEAERRAPGATLGLLGLRLGASLAFELAANGSVAAKRLVLIEPVLNGRQYVMLMGQRKKLRAMLTREEGGVAAAAQATSTATPPFTAGEVEDLDGWELNPELRRELSTLNLANPTAPPGVTITVLQVGPRDTVAPAIQKFAEALGVTVRPVVLQPFWNQLDYVTAEPLIGAVPHE